MKKGLLSTGGLLLTMGLLVGCGESKIEKNDAIVQKTEQTITKKKKNEAASSEAVNETEKQTEAKETSSEKEMTGMNLDQIQKGDYTSLEGEWKQIAISMNRHDSKGDTWMEPRGDSLTVTKEQLENGYAKLKGETLTYRDQEVPMTYRNDNGILSGDATSAWSISFYPKGVPMMNMGPDMPDTIKEETERVFIREAGNNFVQIFEKKSEASSEETTEIKEEGMTLSALKSGDYTSINGTWKNNQGDTLEVKDNILTFSNIEGAEGQSKKGTVSGLSLDIPELNEADGSPQSVDMGEGRLLSKYKKELVGNEESGFYYLSGNMGMARFYVAFLPSGVMGRLTDAEQNQDKIVAGGSQNDVTAVSGQTVYYRLDK